MQDYGYQSVLGVFAQVQKHAWGGKSEVRAALWNTGSGNAFKSFLDVSEDVLGGVVETQITGAFAFARAAVLAFQQNDVDEKGRRGTLLFTGATASIRGNVYTSAFAAGKFALRALSQSLAKEFGKQNIHVAHVSRPLFAGNGSRADSYVEHH